MTGTQCGHSIIKNRGTIDNPVWKCVCGLDFIRADLAPVASEEVNNAIEWAKMALIEHERSMKNDYNPINHAASIHLKTFISASTSR